jgi:4-hydroxy-L-threonine phosphate dehydrogenase PdxA
MKKKIILVSGDPNSINSELIYKSLKKLNSSVKNKIYLITNFNLIEKQLNKLNYKMKFEVVKNIQEQTNSGKIKVINIDLKFKNPFNIPRTLSSRFVQRSLSLAHELAMEKNVIGLINCPINKNLLNAGKTGVTEYLASKCGIKNNSEVMLIKNKKLSVSPITTHIDIKEVSKRINKTKIVKKVLTINKWFKNIYKKNPNIGVLGLNPHNAEFRNKSEEKKIIIPAILQLKHMGINVKGPLVSDTIFMQEYKDYDVLVGMFHDQVLAPFKALFKFDAINITLGLNYLRASPDHGIAVNLIGKNKANPKSLIKCIEYMNKS